MTQKIKLAIVGNCQARPLAALLEMLHADITVICVATVHLLNDTHESEYRTLFEEADCIVAQLVATDYPCSFLRNIELKKKYGQKVKTIVNLYYSGYHPDWCYVRLPDKSMLRGNFSEYHNQILLSGWLKRKSVADTMGDLNSLTFLRENYGNVHQKSIIELKERESNADICISDFIDENFSKTKLFHSFNHPSNTLLLEYAKRITCTLFGATDFISNKILPEKEYLGKISLPIHRCISEKIIQHSTHDKITEAIIRSEFSIYKKALASIPTDKYLLPFDRLKLKTGSIVKDGISPPCDHPRLGVSKLYSSAQYIDSYTDVAVQSCKGLQRVAGEIVDDESVLIKGKVLDLFTPGAVVYIHWLFDLLPKIAILKKANINLEEFDSIVVNSLSSRFQVATIEKLGLSNKNFIPIQDLRNKTIKCELLVKVSPPRTGSSTEHWIIDYVRNLFSENDSLSGMPIQKVYITRANSRRRFVINENEVREFLMANQFCIIDCERYSICEIIHIMSNADIVVGPHGAGMANIAFCKKGTKVVEFFSQHISKDYWLICESLGLDYKCIPCEDETGKKYYDQDLDYENRFFEVNAANIRVDIAELREALDTTHAIAV